MKLKLTISTILLLVLSCDFFIYKKEGLKFNEKSFNTNFKLWHQYKNTSYEFSQEYFDNSRGPMPKIKIEVSDDKLMSSTVISDDIDIDKNNIYFFETITDVYEFIEAVEVSCRESINSNHENSMYGAEIEIIYDEDYHYPLEVKCTGFYEEGVVGGLSSHLNISEFKIK